MTILVTAHKMQEQTVFSSVVECKYLDHAVSEVLM